MIMKTIGCRGTLFSDTPKSIPTACRSACRAQQPPESDFFFFWKVDSQEHYMVIIYDHLGVFSWVLLCIPKSDGLWSEFPIKKWYKIFPHFETPSWGCHHKKGVSFEDRLTARLKFPRCFRNWCPMAEVKLLGLPQWYPMVIVRFPTLQKMATCTGFRCMSMKRWFFGFPWWFP